MKIKTIDITAKQWFDKANGNSYFSAQVTLDFGMKTQKIFRLPYQYGYGNHYTQIAKEELNKRFKLNIPDIMALWRYCQDHKIILRTDKHENCLKKDVVNYGWNI